MFAILLIAVSTLTLTACEEIAYEDERNETSAVSDSAESKSFEDNLTNFENGIIDGTSRIVKNMKDAFER